MHTAQPGSRCVRLHFRRIELHPSKGRTGEGPTLGAVLRRAPRIWQRLDDAVPRRLLTIGRATPPHSGREPPERPRDGEGRCGQAQYAHDQPGDTETAGGGVAAVGGCGRGGLRGGRGGGRRVGLVRRVLRSELEGWGRVLRLFVALRRLLDPADGLAVGVGLEGLEGQLVGVVGELTEGDIEVLVVPGVDLAAGPGDLGDGVGDGAVVGLDRRLELRVRDLGAPTVAWGDEDAEGGVVGGQEDLDLGGARGVFLVGDAEGQDAVGGALGVAVGVDGDVRGGDARGGLDSGRGESGDGAARRSVMRTRDMGWSISVREGRVGVRSDTRSRAAARAAAPRAAAGGL